jgi:NAD(P)-dependent dehydrogenase (short-subunit alcohol dehydrogenase family)
MSLILIAAAVATDEVAEFAQNLGELGTVVLLSEDLASAEGAAAAVGSAEEAHGPADVVVTLPASPPAQTSHTVEISDELWSSTLRDNLIVAMLVVRAAARVMVDRGRGRVAMVTWRLDEPAGLVPLAAACGAVRHLARTLASEIGEQGVTVNAVSVAPGRLADARPALRLLCSPDGGYVTSEALSPSGEIR